MAVRLLPYLVTHLRVVAGLVRLVGILLLTKAVLAVLAQQTLSQALL
jgi:hypothetical protein